MRLLCRDPEARRGVIDLDELASLDVIHGPRRASPATHDRWLEILRATDPQFEFTDPPAPHSLPMALTFAATASWSTAVLTGPHTIAGPPPGVIRLPRPAGAGDMARVSIAGHPLTATAAASAAVSTGQGDWVQDLATPRPGQHGRPGTPAGRPPQRRVGAGLVRAAHRRTVRAPLRRRRGIG